MRVIVVTQDSDGHFRAFFEDDHDAYVEGYETKAEAVGALVLEHSEVFNIQIKEV